MVGIAGTTPVIAQSHMQQPAASIAHPDLWPKIATAPKLDPKVEARITAIMKRMSLKDKVGQLIQVDIASITPKDLETFKIGSVLNGGNSAPGGKAFAPPAAWLKLADAFYDASMKRSDGRPAIPVIWGTDAVHGDNNVVGATLFPHNIGLGAMRDAALVEKIGQVTAAETAATGINWSFAPTVAVSRDDRWGRTYESYSEDPAVVASYSGAMVRGLQGTIGQNFMTPGHVIATVKHFLGDGGTGGHDQGDTRISEAGLRDIHGAGYPPALKAGALTVMVSFSSWNGEKMTGNKSLITGVLVKRWGFQGIVVGDWNAHGQVPGCTNEDCPQAINAGLDMFMYSGNHWKQLYANTLREVQTGVIPMTRLDDAVRRILRVKILSGALDRGRPSAHKTAGDFSIVGSPAHRAIARQAVRESLVLLKNNDHVLPVKPGANVLVAGDGANNIAMQSGGWSLTWQGTGTTNKDFPNGESIWAGIRDAVDATGGTATLSTDGSYTTKPDVAIVVFGEHPYAEFNGDRPTLEFSPDDDSNLKLLHRLKAAGIPVVSVFLSGRPLWVNREINASDAFVAAFLPGTEGEGVADVLIARPDGKPDYDFHGKLSFSWPRRFDQYDLNIGEKPYNPLFPFGYGLTYASDVTVPHLDETHPTNIAGDRNAIFVRGKVAGGARVTPDGAVQVSRTDRNAQEDSLRATFTGTGTVAIDQAEPIDLTRETNGDLSLVMDYRLTSAPAGAVSLGLSGSGKAGMVPVTQKLGTETGAWRTLAVPLRCFAAAGADMKAVGQSFVLTSTGPLGIDISGIQIKSVASPDITCQ
nr:exo 1,3/1,4-beta-D-glucan glucohydrolase [Stakelama sediminis]